MYKVYDNYAITMATSSLGQMLIALESFFSHPLFLISITFISCTLKTIILFHLIKKRRSASVSQWLLFLLIICIVGAITEDISWFIKLLNLNLFPAIDYRIIRLFIRVAWSFYIVRYFAFAVFIEELAEPTGKLNLRQKIFFALSNILILFLLIIAIIDLNCGNAREIYTSEAILLRLLPIFALIMLAPSIYAIAKKLQSRTIPKILKKQLIILLRTLIIPNIAIEILQMSPFNENFTSLTVATNSYTFLGVSIILQTYMIFYSARKMVGLRFLNLNKHVISTRGFNFIDNFKDVLEQLGHATSMQEMTHISCDLFQKAFDIPYRAISLTMCTYQSPLYVPAYSSKTATPAPLDIIINSPHNPLLADLEQSTIFIYDEIAFSNFNERSERTKRIFQFMEDMHADIFIPIFNQQKIVGCIIVERNARPHALYSTTERNEMIVFASYLGNIINLLQNRNLEHLIAREKELKEELYSKHQENNQYKESIRSFLKNKNHQKIGIIFYKNRQFIFGNREAKELIPVNLNMHDGHPLTKRCRNLVTEVQQYKSAQTYFASDSNGSKLVIYGIPHLENNQVTMIVYYPEASDLITRQIDLLKDPSQWDYVLYLETTETGKLINNLIPGTGEQLLSFKIELLKTALSNKATLLDLPTEDIMPTVELLHHISLRTSLHTITLSEPQVTNDLSLKLFGINPLFCINQEQQEPLLKKLDGSGTLFIQNIHFLNHEAQESLAEFIRYGFFRLYKSEQKIVSNVRIICSSSQPLSSLATDNKFSKVLLKELQKTSLAMPPLLSLPEEELSVLTDGYAEQALKNKTYEKFLELNERDHKRIVSSRPTSLQDLKKRVQSFLAQKSRNHEISIENTFDPAFQVTDPELVEIARMGKHALKDERAMTMLWHKFKNQNKIALFLSVNRSTVNRRCKQYNLQ